MHQREPSHDIDAAAAAWVAREDRAPLSETDRQTLEAWLAGDERRRGALLRARAMFMRSGGLAALAELEHDADAVFPARRAFLPRRRFLAWGGGAVAAAAVGTVAGVSALAPSAYATERGEIRLAPLADGSTVMLNTETRVRVKYDGARRFVRLLEGEAYFTVLADQGRPFVVQVGDELLSTTTGVFRVRRLKGSPIDVLVLHGSLNLRGGERGKPSTVVGRNARLLLADDKGDPGVSVEPVSADALARDLAWREGMIAFEGETLAQAAAAFARYSDTHIVVENPALARRRITGLFAANDPAGFGRAAAAVLGASVAVGEGRVVLTPASAQQ